MAKWEPGAAATVVGLASFQLYQAWNQNAPSLAECRSAEPGDITVKQKLVDADLTVGSVAIIVGVALAILTRDPTALILLMVIFGTLSLWSNQVLAAESR